MELTLTPAAISTETALVSLLFLSGVGLFGLAWFAIRQSDGPAIQPLIGFLVFAGGWSVTYGIAVQVHEPATRELLDVLQWVLLAYVPTFWFLFAVEYAGYEAYVTPRRVAALCSVPTLTALFAFTNGRFGLMWSDHTVNDAAGLAVTTYAYEPWLIVNLFYAYGLLLAGVLLLLRLIVTDEGLYADQALSLLVGMFVPWVANVLVMARMVPVPGVDYTPFAFAITGLAFSNALFRYRLLQFLPAIGAIGRDEALEKLEAGVVVLDDSRRTVYVNSAARRLLAIDDVTGEDVTDLIDVDAVDFSAPDGLGELDRGGRTLEVRTSAVVDRRGDRIGHTIVLTDVSQRKRDQRRLERQRDDLQRLEELNATIRGVNRALVSATDRGEIEAAVCDALAASDLYDGAYAADLATWRGEAAGWTTAGATANLRLPAAGEAGLATVADGWVVVPIVAHRRVEGVIGVHTDREAVAESEVAVLTELGELVGHAIDTADRRRSIGTESITEVTLESADDGSVLAAATRETDAECELIGLVPGDEADPVAYLSRDRDADRPRPRTSVVDDAATERSLPTDDADGLIECRVGEQTLLGTLEAHGARVREATAADGTARYVVELPTEETGVLERIETAFPETEVISRTDRERPVDPSSVTFIDATEELTDRQRDVLEVAYRAGYFAWPRDATAEEVADALGITPPTLHAHLRKAEGRVVSRLFDDGA